MPVRLVYYSRALRDMSLQDIQNILSTARHNNAELEICGMLCYESNWFIQALEGDRDEVNELYLEIADDPRHDNIVIISYDYVDSCIFPNWHMGYASNSGLVNQMLTQFGMETLDPEQLTAAQALEFLTTMSSQQDQEAA